LWDVGAARCATTWTHHGDKVQAVAWHRSEVACLATGGDDARVAVRDARRDRVGATFDAPTSVQSIAWNPFRAVELAAACEGGAIVGYDVRTAAAPLWTARASGADVAAVAFSETFSGLAATAGVDGRARLWALNAAGPPTPLAAKDLGVGALYALAFDADDGATLAAGGAGGALALWAAKDDDPAVAAWWVEKQGA
jgi:periodic tryptophan protein 1